ncbi:MAG: recombinase family protein [Ruminococcus flavefaciens]|nr:recombinase family protein [Ruminococcus flavefaciens]
MPIAATKIIREIPAICHKNATVISKRDNVTYYARVSTENPEQEDSYERQRAYFEAKIKSNPEWNYIEGYSDWGVTGTKAEARKNFMRMIEDCRAGKINLILCKSISRFARNTVDTLKYIRELRDLGIGVRFDEPPIDTLSPNGDIMLIILAAMAEQESRTMSSNIKWAYEKRFKAGEVLINYRSTLGYTKEGKDYVIVESEAEIVRRIFREYLSGKALRQICEELNDEGILTKRGNTWSPSAVQGILQNERYAGNAILGKSYKVDVLSKTRKKNEGQSLMVVLENSHPAIVSKAMFDMAQAEQKRRREIRSSVKTGNGRYSSRYPYSGLLICGECGAKLRRFGRKIQSGEYVPTWVCVTHQKNHDACEMLPIKETDIDSAYERVVGRLLGDVAEVKAAVRKTIEAEEQIGRDADLTPIQQALDKERERVREIFQKRRKNEITVAEYEQLYAECSEKILALQDKEKELQTLNMDTQLKQQKLVAVIDAIEGEDTDYTDSTVMRLLLENIKVVGKHELEFQFKCGINITETI